LCRGWRSFALVVYVRAWTKHAEMSWRIHYSISFVLGGSRVKFLIGLFGTAFWSPKRCAEQIRRTNPKKELYGAKLPFSFSLSFCVGNGGPLLWLCMCCAYKSSVVHETSFVSETCFVCKTIPSAKISFDYETSQVLG
jgi:hypothetical protein